MNRLVSNNLAAVASHRLPPRARKGPTRALFLTLDAMGWSTYGSTLACYTGQRDDLDAVHVNFQWRGLRRLLSAPLPGGRGSLDAHVRRIRVASWIIERWLTGPLHLEHFDVVHITPQQYALGAVGAVTTRTPLSVTIDATVHQAKGEFSSLDAAALRRQYWPLMEAERSVFARSSLVTAMSHWAAESVVAEFGVSRDRLVVVPPTIPSSSLRIQEPAFQRDRATRIVFVGNDWARKGGDRLLNWHQERWADCAELHICGRDAQVTSSARNVQHHGVVPRERLLNEILPHTDIFVMPTRKDMSPWAVLEAVAVGLPVVCSGIGGISEIVREGETGYLLPPDDDAGFISAIEGLLADPSRRRQMGRAAQQHFRRHLDAESITNGFLDRLMALAG